MTASAMPEVGVCCSTGARPNKNDKFRLLEEAPENATSRLSPAPDRFVQKLRVSNPPSCRSGSRTCLHQPHCNDLRRMLQVLAGGHFPASIGPDTTVSGFPVSFGAACPIFRTNQPVLGRIPFGVLESGPALRVPDLGDLPSFADRHPQDRLLAGGRACGRADE